MSGAEPPFELVMIQVGCRMLGIPLDPAWHDSVLVNVQMIAAQSQTLLNPPLPDEVEPGPVFTA